MAVYFLVWRGVRKQLQRYVQETQPITALGLNAVIGQLFLRTIWEWNKNTCLSLVDFFLYSYITVLLARVERDCTCGRAMSIPWSTVTLMTGLDLPSVCENPNWKPWYLPSIAVFYSSIVPQPVTLLLSVHGAVVSGLALWRFTMGWSLTL